MYPKTFMFHQTSVRWALYILFKFVKSLIKHLWVGFGGFSKVVATFNHVGESFNLLWPPPGCLNNPIFSNLGLCAACWARFMCHHELWPTSVSHPFSSSNSSLGFAGGKHYQKIISVAYRYRKSISIIELFVSIISIYIGFLATNF